MQAIAGNAAMAVGTALAEKAVERVVRKVKGERRPVNKKKKGRTNPKVFAQQPKSNTKRTPSRQFKNRPVYVHDKYPQKQIFTEESKITKPIVNKFGGKSVVDGIRIKGRVLAAHLDFPNNQFSSYQRTWEFSLNPLSFSNSRLSKLAQCYTKFKFTSVAIEYVTSVGSNAYGSLSTYCIRDPELYVDGQEGTLAFGQAVSQLSGTNSYPVWQSDDTKFSFPNDGSWYFISPDADGEDRFTTQAIVGQMISNRLGLASADTNFDIGTIYLCYDCELWEATMQAENWDSALIIPSYGNTTGTLQIFIDGKDKAGALSPLSQNYMYFGTTADTAYNGLIPGIVYQVIYNFSFGRIKAWQIYYVKTPSAIPPGSAVSEPIYRTIADATSGSGENVVQASGLFTAYPPPNSFVYFTQANQAIDGLTKNLKVASLSTTQTGFGSTTTSEIDILRSKLKKLELAQKSPEDGIDEFDLSINTQQQVKAVNPVNGRGASPLRQ